MRNQEISSVFPFGNANLVTLSLMAATTSEMIIDGNQIACIFIDMDVSQEFGRALFLIGISLFGRTGFAMVMTALFCAMLRIYLPQIVDFHDTHPVLGLKKGE